MNVVFSHGKESGPWGDKIQALAAVARDRGLDVESLDYRGMDDPGARVDKLVDYLEQHEGPVVLVGSSMGGHVAAAAAGRCPVKGVFLMAPAFYMPGYESLTPAAPACPTAIVHGWDDEVVPVDNALRYAREAGCTLHVLDDDHRLTASIPSLEVLFGLFLDGLAAD